MKLALLRIACIATAAAFMPLSHAQLVRSGAGADAGDILAIVNAFRADLGDPNNGNTPGSQGSGRREISWDGGGAAAQATFFGVPMTTFANRGSVFTTPGTGFEISGQPSPLFGDINPQYPLIFDAFSAPRIFTALGSNIIDVSFTIPGSATDAALTTGFGAVFTDVDLANTSSIEYFDAFDVSLGTFFVPNVAGADGTLSFLGVTFADPIVARARIRLGNTALGAFANDGGSTDVVALDEFIYGEPVARVDEPATLALLALGALLALRRKA